MRLLMAVIGLVVASLELAGPAAGRAPERETIPIDDVDVIADLCTAPDRLSGDGQDQGDHARQPGRQRALY